MSASNWGVCPKCARNKVLDIEKLEKEIETSYGQVDRKQYQTLLNQLDNWMSEEPKNDLREDWEIGTDENGEFFVSYDCYCSVCKFKFKFEVTQDALDG